jgi:hypothetical protein
MRPIDGAVPRVRVVVSGKGRAFVEAILGAAVTYCLACEYVAGC